MHIARLAFLIVLIGSAFVAPLLAQKSRTYPAIWFDPINGPNKPVWVLLPQERQAVAVVFAEAPTSKPPSANSRSINWKSWVIYWLS